MKLCLAAHLVLALKLQGTKGNKSKFRKEIMITSTGDGYGKAETVVLNDEDNAQADMNTNTVVGEVMFTWMFRSKCNKISTKH